ncbi:IreB family regulatory phosphoprotein [Syntrophomonas curvata]
MPQVSDETVSFNKERDDSNKVQAILQAVYAALEEKGYNPINQLVGYMISGDPAYITSHNNARSLICKVDRDEILEILLKNYLQK